MLVCSSQKTLKRKCKAQPLAGWGLLTHSRGQASLSELSLQSYNLLSSNTIEKKFQAERTLQSARPKWFRTPAGCRLSELSWNPHLHLWLKAKSAAALRWKPRLLLGLCWHKWAFPPPIPAWLSSPFLKWPDSHKERKGKGWSTPSTWAQEGLSLQLLWYEGEPFFFFNYLIAFILHIYKSNSFTREIVFTQPPYIWKYYVEV